MTEHHFKPFSFATLSFTSKPPTTVLIVREEGSSIYFRSIRDDGALGNEDVIHRKTGRLRPLPQNHKLRLVVEGRDLSTIKNKESWEVTVPDLNTEEWRVFRAPLSRTEALRIARDHFGADSQGRIFIVNRVSEETL